MNVKPGTLFIGDNLDVLRGIDSESVDLIYLDPPFHSDKKWLAPTNSEASGAEFHDVFYPSELKDEWVDSVREASPALYSLCSAAKAMPSRKRKRASQGEMRYAYLIFMAVRLLECHRVLKETGSLWLHCDWHADGYLRVLLDAIFGMEQLRNEVKWCYTGPGSPGMRQFNRKDDTLFWYSKGKTWTFNSDAVRIPYKPGIEAKLKKTDANIWGALTSAQAKAYADKGKIPESWWADCPASWYMPSKEKTGYPTQKPLKLLERIVLACSNEEDVVLDPFCGCATTMVAAQKLGRQWVGIDRSPKAQELCLSRMGREAGLFDAAHHLLMTAEPPIRTDDGLTASEQLVSEFELARQESKILTAGQKAALKAKLWLETGGRCPGVPGRRCGMVLPPEYFEMDHIHPKSRGGLDRADNFQLLCAPCNRKKGAS